MGCAPEASLQEDLRLSLGHVSLVGFEDANGAPMVMYVSDDQEVLEDFNVALTKGNTSLHIEPLRASSYGRLRVDLEGGRFALFTLSARMSSEGDIEELMHIYKQK